MKKIKVLLAALLISLAGSAHSFVTTDPTSYTYFIEQINQTTQMIENTAKTVQTGAGTLTAIQAMKKAAEGSYNRALRAVNNAKKASEDLAGTEPIFDEVLDPSSTRYASKKDLKKWTGKNKYKNSSAYLDQIFKDAREKPKSEQEAIILKNIRANLRQKSVKNTIVISQKIMAAQKDRLKNLSELAGLIDKTENMKDALDLNNRFLFELVRLNVELLTVVVQLAESQSLNTYTGYSAKIASEDARELKMLNKRQVSPALKKFEAHAKTISIKGLN